jgi:hypothetical protein
MGTTLKSVVSILAMQLWMATLVWGQMPGMANRPSQPPDDSNASTSAMNRSHVTFTKGIAPVVQAHCQTGHGPGEGTPFSLLTYESARPWAKAMKRMVLERAMPPWFEDGTEKFANNRSLTQAEIDTIVAWANTGAPRGDPKDLPPPKQFIEGGTIPKPDVTWQLPQPFPVPLAR